MVPCLHPQEHHHIPPHHTLTPSAIAFCRTEILEIYLWGFIITLSEEESICLFGTLIRISRLGFVDQQNCKPCIVCNF